jgi:hypothetical protein
LANAARRDRAEIDADVMLEVTILDRLQATQQQRRHIGQMHESDALPDLAP